MYVQISTYETYCGGLSYYGIKYGNVFANMCNNGTQQSQLAEVASEVCSSEVCGDFVEESVERLQPSGGNKE